DLHALRPDETSVTLEHRASFQCLQGSLDPFARRAHNGVLARLYRFHVDGDGTADGHTVVAGAACEVRRVGARNQGLGRGAAGIHAGTAEKLALDDSNLRACSRPPPRVAPACPVPMMIAS